MLRRRIADCASLANRIEIILDDLLWILSDRQIQATLLCVKSLSEAIEASKEIQKINLECQTIKSFYFKNSILQEPGTLKLTFESLQIQKLISLKMVTLKYLNESRNLSESESVKQ